MRRPLSPSPAPLTVRCTLPLDAVLDDPRVGLHVIERQPILGIKDEQLEMQSQQDEKKNSTTDGSSPLYQLEGGNEEG